MSDLVESREGVDAGEVAAVNPAGPHAALAAPSAETLPTQTASSPEKFRRKIRSDEEVAYWRSAVDEWNALLEAAKSAGGLFPSIRGFCRDRKLREPSFYWWRREFAIRDGKPLPTMRSMDSTRSRGHRPANRPETPATFVQLRVRPSPATGSLCELVVGKVVVRVSPGFDADELTRLLDVLHAR